MSAILVHDKKRKYITLIEIEITIQDGLQTVKTEKKYKYDILANKLEQEYKYKTKKTNLLISAIYKITSENITKSSPDKPSQQQCRLMPSKF